MLKCAIFTVHGLLTEIASFKKPALSAIDPQL